MAWNDLSLTKGDKGPQHRIIENSSYKIETLPTSGQIWHITNKLGSHADWFHHEWDSNVDKGGDPCHWAPNSWIGYPERVAGGYELKAFQDIDFIEWHYVFGWDNPETTVREEKDFIEIVRRGVVYSHPEHTNNEIYRDGKDLIWAEVTYRFFDGQPHFFQSSTIRTLAPVPVFFIRNCQYVFQSHYFTHLLMAPDRTGLKKSDIVEPSVLPLMSYFRNKPISTEHSLSNILPSKLAYTGFINDETHDGFALFQLKEENTNLISGNPTYGNHHTILTGRQDWAVYFSRAFSYTNQRFNPENMTYLPEGEQYYEENMGLIFRHETIGDTLSLLNEKLIEFSS